MREEVSQAMSSNYFLGYNNVVSDLCFPAFLVIIDMQNCTHLLSFDICIHPRNHYPNQDTDLSISSPKFYAPS